MVFPQQVGIAEPDKAAIALDRIQKEWVNDQWGFVHQRKPKIAGDGVGVVHNNVLAQTAFAYGRTELGWRLMQLSAKAPLGERLLGAFDETLPGGGDLVQLWSFGPFLECVVEGLAGIRPQPDANHVDLFPQLPQGLEWFTLQDSRVGEHTVTLDHRRTGGRITTTVTHSRGKAPLTGTFWFPTEAGAGITINGQALQPPTRRVPLIGVERSGVDYDLRPGQTLSVIWDTP